jgi:hypothetical protein
LFLGISLHYQDVLVAFIRGEAPSIGSERTAEVKFKKITVEDLTRLVKMSRLAKVVFEMQATAKTLENVIDLRFRLLQFLAEGATPGLGLSRRAGPVCRLRARSPCPDRLPIWRMLVGPLERGHKKPLIGGHGSGFGGLRVVRWLPPPHQASNLAVGEPSTG